MGQLKVSLAAGSDKDRARELQLMVDSAKRTADAATQEAKELRARLKKLSRARGGDSDDPEVGLGSRCLSRCLDASARIPRIT